jgi:hypothetical protein
MSDDRIDIQYHLADINELTGIDRKKANREIISQLNSNSDNFSQNKYINDLVQDAVGGENFSKINETLTERLELLTDDQGEYTPNNPVPFRLPLIDLFRNVIVDSARGLELVLRLMRRQSTLHLRDIFEEDDEDNRESNLFYESARFNFDKLTEGFSQSKTSDGKSKNFAIYKEGPVVFALTPGEVYCFNDGKLKLGYQNGTGGVLSNPFDYKMQWLNQVTDTEGKSFVKPANNLLEQIHDSKSGKSIVSNKWINAYMMLANESDFWSQKHNLTPSDHLADLKRRDPKISELLSPDLEKIIVTEYKNGRSPHSIRKSLERGQTPLYKQKNLN